MRLFGGRSTPPVPELLEGGGEVPDIELVDKSSNDPSSSATGVNVVPSGSLGALGEAKAEVEAELEAVPGASWSILKEVIGANLSIAALEVAEAAEAGLGLRDITG